MPTRRLLLDHILRPITPSPDPSFAPEPVRLRGGLWAIDRRLHLLGALMPCRSMLVRLANGELVVIGSPALPSQCAPQVERLGHVAAVVAPNVFHYLYAAEGLAAFSVPALVLAPGLAERIPNLPPAVALGDPSLKWAPDLEYAVFGPVRGVSEVIFYHVPSRTVVFTDLASNLVDSNYVRGRDRWISRAYGMPAGFAPSRNARLLLRVDRDATRRVLRKVLEWPFEAVVVAHGEILEKDARRKFNAAFARYL